MQTRKGFKILSFLGLVVFFGILALGIWIFWKLPTLDTLEKNLSVPSIRITDRHNRILHEFIDREGGRNSPVPLTSIPSNLLLATIATEDQNFYHHPGVDIIGILRAFWINLQGGETLAGGSTITQQVARNLLLSENEQFERTLRRKLRESWLAWRITKKYTRDEILGLYLNQMYYGGLSYGVEAASQTYFGRSVSELNLAEITLIAGIPQGPAIYNPLVDPAAAQNRQHIVLELMHKQGFITKDEFDLAKRQRINFASSPYPVEAPHFVMLVNSQVDQILPIERRSPSETLIVRTTLDLDLQHLAEKAVTKHLQALGDRKPTTLSSGTGSSHNVPGGHNVNNAALVAMDPMTGDVLSMVGSPDYFNTSISGAINMSISPRQPGSALKPIIYAASFSPDYPDPLTPATMLLDVKTTFVIDGDKAYVPANFDNQEHGPVSARQALASSLNIPAVVVLNQIGMDRFFDLAAALGITTFIDPADYDLSLALGGGEVTLLELTSSYAAFANSGNRVDPSTILEISTLDGDIIYQRPHSAKVKVVDERVCWLISDILNDNEARSIGFGRNTALQIDRPAAVKTGTTTNFHDNWTIGYTPNLLTGVWVGNASHEPMRGVTGLSGAGPIWHQFIREALTGTPKDWFEKPKTIVDAEVCSLSGLLPTDACPYTKHEWFIYGTEPVTPDYIFQQLWIDAQTGYLATANTLPVNKIALTALNLPPSAHPWARDHDIPLIADFESPPDRMGSNEEGVFISIISPGNMSRFYIDPSIPPETQKIHIQVAVSTNLDQIDLWMDGTLFSTLNRPPYETWWQLEIGEHALWAETQSPSGEVFRSQIINISVTEEP